MDSIQFHFHGDVNINVSLPEDADTAADFIAGISGDSDNYQKLVDSLEEFLHDAADEMETAEHDVDSIVMVVKPGEVPEVMLESACWDEVESRGCYDCVEVLSDPELDVDGLLISYDAGHVLMLGRERYLLGPVIVYECDGDGDGVSLDAEDMIAAVVYFTNHTVTLCADGEDFPAFRI